MSQKLFLFLIIIGFFGCFKAKRSPYDTSTPSGAALNVLNIKPLKQLEQIATPTFSPSAGLITSLTNITISTSTS
ncbi:MAG: hypothetical protein N3A69_07110, partial [Leptospiraceae bacterium]|nr:hypothetical protein [Leptospiraceae bacterium]